MPQLMGGGRTQHQEAIISCFYNFNILEWDQKQILEHASIEDIKYDNTSRIIVAYFKREPLAI